MVRSVAWFAGVVVLLAGCARMPVSVPNSVGTAGVVVAEIRSNFIDVNGKYRPLGIGEYRNLLSPQINGITYERALRDGFLVLTLPPGEYRMTNLNGGTTGPSIAGWLNAGLKRPCAMVSLTTWKAPADRSTSSRCPPARKRA